MRRIVTREEYFESALSILGAHGPGGLKISALCGSLEVTSGSFYGYFGSLDGFVEEFLQYWEETQTESIANIITRPPEPADRIHLAKELAATLPHAAESAIRSWASTNEKVAAMQRLVDARRIEAISDILRPAAADDEEAHSLAVMATTLLVGLQQMHHPVTDDDFDTVFDELEEFMLLKLAARGECPAKGSKTAAARSRQRQRAH